MYISQIKGLHSMKNSKYTLNPDSNLLYQDLVPNPACERNFASRSKSVKNKKSKPGNHLSYAKMEDLSGVDAKKIEKILNGTQRVTLHEAIGISRSLGTTIYYLADMEEAKYFIEQGALMRKHFEDDLVHIDTTIKMLLARKEKVLERLEYLTGTVVNLDALDEYSG